MGVNVYSEKPNNRKQKVIAGIIVIIAIVLLAIVAAVSANQKKDSSSTSTTSTPSTTTTTETPAPSTSTTFKDGTYTASKRYFVSGEYQSIDVTVTLTSDIVTDSTVVNSSTDGESKAFQDDFASGYKTKVVGKSISGLQLSSIAGASDTTRGFNAALTDIQNQAKT